ncbi:chorismate mutase [Lachnospiraceae bacterium C7]|nr:chorismate mutase [Lachnospiraceae bacterium C7]
MATKTKYYVLRDKAVPEVLIKVVNAKRLIDSGKVSSVQEATEMVGISRSSFYKYKDEINLYHENEKGKTVNMVIQLDDEPGLLSMVLKTIADFKANVLTIHQSIPVHGIATLTVSIDVFKETGDVDALVDAIETVSGIHYAKILSRE